MKTRWLYQAFFCFLLQPGQSRSLGAETRGGLSKRIPDDKRLPADDIGSLFRPDFDGVVYRGDARPFNEIKDARGFYPKPGPDVESKYSLYSHISGNLQNTAFVSTSESVGRAASYAKQGLLLPDHAAKKVSYVYQIDAARDTFVDVTRTLRLQRVIGNLEHAAMGGIPWEHVSAYAALTPDQLDAISRGETKLKDINFTPNPDHKPPPKRGSTPRPKIAGWPAGHQAWREEPWRRLLARNKDQLLDVKVEFEKILNSPSSSNLSPCKRDGTSCLQRLNRKQLAARRFEVMAKRNGLTGLIAGKDGRVTFPKLSATLSKTFGPKLKYRAKLSSISPGGASTTAVALGLWAKELVNVFSTESSGSERFAVATSLIPVVSCVTQSLSDTENGRNEIVTGVDTGLCIVADALTFIPGGGLVSFAIHTVRALFRIIENVILPRDGPEIEKTHFQYKWGWTQYTTRLQNTIRSNEFKGNLTSKLVAEKLDVLYMAGEAAGSIESKLNAAAINGTEVAEPEATEEGGPDNNAKTPPSGADASTESPAPASNPVIVDELDATDPSNYAVDLVPDLQPQICQAYLERKERLFKNMTERLESHLEDAYEKYDLEFFNKYFYWLYKHLRQIRGIWPSADTIEKERDEHIQKVMDTWKRKDKPGLNPGPGTDQMRTVVREVFDEITRHDPCKDIWNPPRGKDDPEPLPELPKPVDIPKEQRELEEKEARWRDELGLVTQWEKEKELEEKAWATVRQEEWQLRTRSGAWPPRKDSDTPDPTIGFDRWRRFNEIMAEYDQKN